MMSYVLDGGRRRVGKKVNGSLVQGFIYQDGLRVIAELDGNNVIVSRFVYGSNPVTPDYMMKQGRPYRIIADHLGSPRFVVDGSGQVVQALQVHAFGVIQSEYTNPGFQPFGFAGGLYDENTQAPPFWSARVRSGAWSLAFERPWHVCYWCDKPVHLRVAGSG